MPRDERLPVDRVTTATDSRQLAAVRRYYDGTWHDYRVLWMNRHNRALHFGFWGPHTRTHEDSLIEMNQQVARAASVSPGDQVLDLGCGVGGTVMWMAEALGSTGCGIAVVPTQIERAARYARERGLARRVTFAVQDYAATGFRDQSFDVVYCLESLCHAADKAAVLDEAFRMLRPGGRLVVCEPFTHVLERAEDEQALQCWLENWAIPGLPVADDLVTHARDLGFTGVRVDDWTSHVLPSLRRLHRISLVLSPFAILSRVIRVRSRVSHENVRGARGLMKPLRHGLWFYGNLVATKPARAPDRRPA